MRSRSRVEEIMGLLTVTNGTDVGAILDPRTGGS